ncbi:MAG: TIGR04563 family protein [Sandaracinaceae bacterium]|nr:MAG: TIGR04563 family protein [Sandaracinaceae bacterium]
MAGSDKRKQSLYIPQAMLEEINREMDRLDRSRSWIVQRCIKIALPEIKKLPSVNDIDDDDRDEDE